MNYTQLTQLSDAVGKTIARWYHDRLIIFSDDTFLVLESGDENIEAATQLSVWDLHTYGLMSDEEFEATKRERQARYDAEREAQRRADYERLKKEFGNE